jgi:hypothetical protein
MNKRKAFIGSLVVLLLAVAAWGFGLIGGTDPAIAKLHDIGGQMQDKNLTDAQRTELRGQFREQMQSMTEDQRRAFFESNRGQWEARQQQRMDEFFAMSKADQVKRLDEIINRMTQPRTNRQGAGPGQGGQTGALGKGGGQGQGQSAGGANSGGRGNRANMTDEQREERSKRRIENSDPKSRAQMANFRKMLDQRAQQRGVTLPSFGGGGAGRGFGPRGA